MKILKIYGKNLASIAGDFEIDFTSGPLCSAGIFAICGPTGSGKSTILDAVCLALYNTTPRTTGIEDAKVTDTSNGFIQQSDRRQILRRGTTEAIAAVEFIAIDNKTYRSVWRVWRANNKPTGKLQPAELRVYDISTQTPLTTGILESTNKLIQLTGLTYNQFTRTVLLAQNEFARFLKAKKDEKADVLEKLTGTEIYSVISNLVYNKTATLRTEWKELKNRIQGIEILSSEELSQLQQQLENDILTEKGLRQKNEELLSRIKWHEQLNVLELSLKEAKLHFEETAQRYEAAGERKKWIEKIEGIEESRAMWTPKTEYTINLLQKQEQLQLLSAQIADLTAKADKSTLETETQQKTVNEYTFNYNKKKPEILQARRLDVEINNARLLLADSKQTVEQIHLKIQEEEKLRNERKQEEERIRKQVGELQLWFEKNKIHGDMCRNMGMITGFLDSAYDTVHSITSTKQEINLQCRKQKEKENFAEQQEKILSKQSEKYSILTQQQLKIKALQNITSITTLRKEKDELLQQKEKFQQAQITLEKLNLIQQEIGFNREKMQEYQEQLTVISQKTLNCRKKTENYNIRKITLQQAFQKAQLAASSNVAALREQLQEGQACPVCGSCQHPYTHVTDIPEISALNSLKVEVEEAEQEYFRLQEESAQLKAHETHLKETLLSLKEKINLLTKECEVTFLKWKHHTSLIGSAPTLQESDIDQRLKILSSRLEEINKQEEQWEINEIQLQQNEQQIEKIRQENELLHQQFQETRNQIALITAELSKNSGILEKLQSQQNNLLDKIKAQISIPNWQLRWQQDYPHFRQELNSATEKWQNKEKQLTEKEKQLSRLSAEQSAQIKNFTLLQQNEVAEKNILLKRETTLNQLVNERNAILDGKDAEETEKYWQQLIQEAENHYELLVKEKNELIAKLQQLKGQQEQSEKEIKGIQILLQKATDQLEKWLIHYNTTHLEPINEEQLANLLAIPSAQVKTEREQQKLLQEQYTASQATLAERNKQWKAHLKLNITDTQTAYLPVLQAKRQELLQQMEEVNRTKSMHLARLHIQEQNRQQSQALAELLDTKSELLNQWSKLDELIGSQNGNKFKEIAQGYTLDILLTYANLQLKELTSRYQLQRVPGELALQVVDHDLCDEVRSVFSLSGGESFLVSLALALGLSSFSARNHFEENLFIDEGFGTLDAETLQIVMEALERLRSQGRQVGIISHVHELTERIPARICLIKSGNGKSKIKIEG